MKPRTKSEEKKELLKTISEVTSMSADVTKYIWLKWVEISEYTELSLRRNGKKFSVIYCPKNKLEDKVVKTGSISKCLDFVLDRYIGEQRYSK